jgi:NAD(P)-dependent dehydrogenase (short-subunit alcohol dehydrogenase family)
MRMADEIALVTGGTRGIGAAIARRFAGEGAAVVITGRSADLGEQVVAGIQSDGGRVAFVTADVGTETDVVAAMNTARERFGPLTVLVNNAAPTTFIAQGGDGPIARQTTENFDQILKVGLYGPFWCCKYAIPQMIEAGHGSIVNISSLSAVSGLPGLPTYSAIKGAMNSMTRQIAVDYAHHRIRVNAIVCGIVINEFSAAAFASPETRAAQQAIQLTRLGEVDDIARMATYLASTEADYISGSILHIDGGMSALGNFQADRTLEKIDEDLAAQG